MMHQALSIPELLALIVEECKSSRSSLASLASACRRFTECCVNALYESATVDLFDLVKFLPFARSHSIEVTRYRYLEFDRDKVPFDTGSWKSFSHLAGKARSLKISFDSLSEEVFIILFTKFQIHGLQAPGRPVIFGQMRSLTIAGFATDESEKPFALALIPFLTGTLGRLSVHIDCTRLRDCSLSEIGGLGPILANLCPNLSALQFELISDHVVDIFPEGTLMDDCWDFLTSVIESCNHLTSLDIDCDGLYLSNFLELPHHQFRQPTLRSYDSTPEIFRVSKPCLPSLTCLDYDLHPESLVCALESLDRPKLIQARLKTDNPCDGDDGDWDSSDELEDNFDEAYYGTQTLKGILAKFADHTQPSSLEMSAVSFRCSKPIRLSSLLPLLNYKCLQELELQIDSLWIHDRDIANLAKTLPQLSSLVLPDVPGLTLDSLVSVSRHFNHLTRLTTSIDASDVPPTIFFQKHKVGNRVFIRLTLHDSPIANSAAVSSFLQFVLPSILAVEMKVGKVNNRIAKRRQELWSRVSDLISI